MSDEKDTALPHRLRTQATWVGDPNAVVERIRDVMLEAADALEASVQAPAVDAETLRQRITNDLLAAFPQWRDEVHAVSDFASSLTKSILASDILQDAAERAGASIGTVYRYHPEVRNGLGL